MLTNFWGKCEHTYQAFCTSAGGAFFRLPQDPQNENAHSANVGLGTGILRTRSGTLISTLIKENFLGEVF